MNVIAATAVLEGTIRAFEGRLQTLLRERITAVAEGVAASLGATARVEFSSLVFPPTVNDPELARLVRGVAEEVVGADRVRSDPAIRTMAAEDFAEFAARVPGCFFFLGGSDEAEGVVHPHHSPFFDLSEEALALGVEILERAAIEFLRGAPT